MKSDEKPEPTDERARAQAEDGSKATDEDREESLPSVLQGEELRKLAVTPGLQALWGVVLPLVGVQPSRPGEYPGIFKVEAGPGDDEATIYVDVPDQPYRYGETPPMERVLTLTVKLGHDYRLLGDRYYCVDCEAPTDEASH